MPSTIDLTQANPDVESRWGADAPVLVPAVERASRLLDRLTVDRRGGATLAQLAAELKLPKSSVHNLLRTLVKLGMVRREVGGGFALGPKVLEWAGAYSGQKGLVEGFYDAASSLPALQSETIMLSVLVGAEVLYLACRPGTYPLAVNFRVGGRFPATTTASGKAMLATMPEPTARAAVGAGPFAQLTTRSRADWAALAPDLRHAQRHGIGIDDEETAAGMHCIGAPVFEAGNPTAVAAVAVSLIKASVEPAKREVIISALQALAARLSRLLGGDVARSPSWQEA